MKKMMQDPDWKPPPLEVSDSSDDDDLDDMLMDMSKDLQRYVSKYDRSKNPLYLKKIKDLCYLTYNQIVNNKK